MGALVDLINKKERSSPGAFAKKVVRETGDTAKSLAIGSGTLLGGILKQLSRPGYAATTALHKLGAGGNLPEVAGAAKEGFMLEDAKKGGYEVASQILEQLKEREKASGRKPLMPERFAPPEAVQEGAKRGLGLMVDVATDPLNILSPQIAQGVAKTAEVAKAKVALPLAKTKVGQTLGGLFSKDFGLKTKFPELAKDAGSIDDILKHQQALSIDEARRIVEIVPDANERKFITNVLENPQLEGELGKASKPAQKIYGWLKKVRERTEKGVVDRDLLPEEQLIDFYVRHARTEKPGVIGRIKSLIREGLPGSLKKRKIEGSIQEINERLGKPFFENDIAIVHGISQAETRRAFAAHDYLRKIADNPQITEPLEQIAKAGKKIMGPVKEGFETISHPLFQGKQVPAEVAQHIRRIQKTAISDESLNAFVKAHDNILNWWKGQVLISPAYHFRNMIGNYWNNWLGGVDDPQRYIQAGKMQFAGRGGAKGLNGVVMPLGKQTYRGKQIMDLAQKHGVVDQGWYGADIPETVMQQMKGMNWKPWSKDFRLYHPIRFNREIGSLVENNARLAHFMDRLAKGDDAATAALSVKKYLFDYSNLAPFEQAVMKRMLPFYTWSRKNIPLQLSNMVLQPGKYAKVEKGIRAVQLRGDEGEVENMPEWMKERFGVPLFKKDNDTYAMVMENWLPAMDVNKLARPDELLTMANPLIKTPVEIAMNKSTFFKQPLEEYEGQTKPFGPFDVSARNVHPWVSQVRVMNELNRVAENYDQWPEYVRFVTGGKLYKYDPEIQKGYELLKKSRDIQDLIGFLSLVSKRGVRSQTKASKEHSKREVKRIKEKIMAISKRNEKGSTTKTTPKGGAIQKLINDKGWK